MGMRAIVMAAALLAACSGEDEGLNFPSVESRYEIVDGRVECRGTTDEQWSPEAGPFTRYTCTWERVTVAGVPTCSAVLVFERADEASPWSLVASFTSDATRCT